MQPTLSRYRFVMTFMFMLLVMAAVPLAIPPRQAHAQASEAMFFHVEEEKQFSNGDGVRGIGADFGQYRPYVPAISGDWSVAQMFVSNQSIENVKKKTSLALLLSLAGLSILLTMEIPSRTCS